jgi:hypothetical protein
MGQVSKLVEVQLHTHTTSFLNGYCASRAGFTVEVTSFRLLTPTWYPSDREFSEVMNATLVLKILKRAADSSAPEYFLPNILTKTVKAAGALTCRQGSST